MSKVNILYIIEGGFPGGAELNLLTVIREIDKTRYQIRVCLFKPSVILEEELRELGVPVFILNFVIKYDIFSILRLSRFMLQEQIDIVHTSLYVSNTFGRIAAILARVPIIIAWEHGETAKQPSRHCKINRILARFTNCIIACSKAVKEKIIAIEGIPGYKIRVIYNCVDLDKFNPLVDTSAIKSQLGIKSDEILIGSVGRLDKVKGQEYLIEAMPQIIKVYPKIKLLLVGKGSLESYLVSTISYLNIKDRVILTGYRRDIPKIMNALDIYICPSLNESLGVSIIEAMSLKKPVIATRVYGIPEVVVENQTGYLIPPKDIDSIVKFVINLLADPEKMRQMGEAGFERVKARFSSGLIIKEIEALYKELLCKIHRKYQ